MDELADRNGRVALIVGKFDLEDWLSGDLVQTMLVKAIADNPRECVAQEPVAGPSAARLGNDAPLLGRDCRGSSQDDS